jgi:excisionase family DNA binding protein
VLRRSDSVNGRCEHSNVLIEDGARRCADCGHEIDPPPSQALDLIADRVVEKLASQLGHREGWVGVEQAAAYLHCKPHRIYDLCSRQGLPHTKEGIRSLFKLSELDAWLEGRNAA